MCARQCEISAVKRRPGNESRKKRKSWRFRFLFYGALSNRRFTVRVRPALPRRCSRCAAFLPARDFGGRGEYRAQAILALALGVARRPRSRTRLRTRLGSRASRAVRRAALVARARSGVFAPHVRTRSSPPSSIASSDVFLGTFGAADEILVPAQDAHRGGPERARRRALGACTPGRSPRARALARARRALARAASRRTASRPSRTSAGAACTSPAPPPPAWTRARSAIRRTSTRASLPAHLVPEPARVRRGRAEPGRRWRSPRARTSRNLALFLFRRADAELPVPQDGG